MELVWLMGSERGKRFPLLGGRATFGRASDNNIVLSDPTISTHHGVLVYEEEREVVFYDIASRNGISVEGQRSHRIVLKPGQRIQIGSVYFQLVSTENTVLHNTSWSWKKKQAWMPIGAVFLCLVSLPSLLNPIKTKVNDPQPPAPVIQSVPQSTVPSTVQEKPFRRPRMMISRHEPKKTDLEQAPPQEADASKLFEESLMRPN